MCRTAENGATVAGMSEADVSFLVTVLVGFCLYAAWCVWSVRRNDRRRDAERRAAGERRARVLEDWRRRDDARHGW